MGDPFFDLGNFSVNHDLTPDEDAMLLEAYEGERRGADRLARLRLMRVVSDFREAMWGVLQQAISTLDVDFVSYANHTSSGCSQMPPIRRLPRPWMEWPHADRRLRTVRPPVLRSFACGPRSPLLEHRTRPSG